MDQKETLTKLLRQVATTLERSSSADVEALIFGRAELIISNRGHKQPQKREGVGLQLAESAKLEALIAQFKTLASRDEGWNLLASADLTKRELEKLARLMDLPVLREDDAERLRQKIVEQSIGSRLNSRAVRG
ncbi:MAG: hypothetical protein WBX38_01315 [Candidatus Sulfotelmatobacter sp.]